MSKFADKKARLVQKRASHVANLKRTEQAIVDIDARIEECNKQIAAETTETTAG